MIQARLVVDDGWAESILFRLSDIQNMLTKYFSAHALEDDRPRTPPPPPTDIQFPHHRTRARSASTLQPGQSLQDLYGRPTRTPLFLTPQHIEALNLHVEEDVPLKQLVPKNQLPAPSWHTDASQNEDSEIPAIQASGKKLSNGATEPGFEIYEQRMKELSIDNEDAFRYIQRKPPRSPQPSPPIKISHFRKFYDSLLAMAEYWDTSLDQYHTEIPDWEYNENDVIKEYWLARLRKEYPDDASISKPNIAYTGRRRDVGSDMPERIREDVVRGLVEPIAWSFGSRLESPRLGIPPRLKMHNLLLPIKQSGTVYRAPRDRQRAKMGILEGPLLGIQCRSETNFLRTPITHNKEKSEYLLQSIPETKDELGERSEHAGEEIVSNLAEEDESKEELLDLAREVGAMLLIAQERAREGKIEVKLENRWWAKDPTPKPMKTQPTAKGFMNSNDSASKIASSIPNTETTSHWKTKIRNDGQKREMNSQCCASSTPDKDTEAVIGAAKSYKKQKREKPASLNVKTGALPPSSLWDPKISYQRIGNEVGSEIDDVS